MLEPRDLYELVPDLPELGRPVLVNGLTGFVDAGAAARQVGEHLLAAREHRVVATFDLDQLLDYRSRRPIMTFASDHWENYDQPSLALHLLHDEAGTPFLLLAGPEPDLQWERFTAAVRDLVERLGVRLTVGLSSIPMGVPHTRPTGLTAHATRSDLVAGYEPWAGTVAVPASASALLELRLGQAGHDAMGFAAHVPHYLAQSEYPPAAEALVEAVARAAGLVLPSDALTAAAERVRAEIAEQVQRSEEVTAVVRALEQQYDAYVGTRGRGTLLAADAAQLPTADELGAEFEAFLAEQEPGSGSGPDA